MSGGRAPGDPMFIGGTFYKPGAKIDGSDPDHALLQAPMVIGRSVSLPASLGIGGHGPIGQPPTAIFVQLTMSSGHGLHNLLTPASARLFAAALLSSADDVEAAASAAATAALARAAKP